MINRLTAFILLLGVASAARAGVWQSFPSQPAGGYGLEVAIGYDNAQPVLYAAVRSAGEGRIYKSTDYGNCWVGVFTHPGVYAVRAVTDNPQVVFAGGDGEMGVYRSTNGGNTWEPKNNGISDLDINTIVIAPSDHNVVYAAGGRVHQPGRLYRTTDAGELWTDIYPPWPVPQNRLTDVCVHPEDKNTVLVSCMGSSSFYGIWKTTDGGSNWRRVCDSYYMFCVAFNEVDPDIAYAAFGYRFYRSTDAGETWTEIATIPPLETANEIWSIAPHPNDQQVVFVSRKRVGVWASTNGGFDWEDRNSGVCMRDMNRTRLTWDRVNTVGIFSGESEAGVYRSLDGGCEWSQVSKGLPSKVLTEVAADGSGGYVWARGVLGNTEVTANGGEDWCQTSPTIGGSVINDLLAPSPDNLVIGYSGCVVWEPGEEENIVYYMLRRSTDCGFTWWLTYGDDGCLNDIAFAPNSPDRMYGVGSYGDISHILRSDDGGLGWYRSLPSTPRSLNCLAVSYNDKDVLYIGCRNGAFLVSEDGGYSIEDVGVVPDSVFCIVLDPLDEDVIYAGTPAGVYKSTDAGGSWQLASSGIEYLRVRALVLDVSNPSWLWVSTLDGSGKGHVYCTADGAQAWVKASEGLPIGVIVGGLFVTADRVYAATSEGVLYRDTRFIGSSSPEATFPNWGYKLAREPNTQNLHVVYVDGSCVYYVPSPDGGSTWDEPELVGLGSEPAVVLNRGFGGVEQTPWVVYRTAEGDIVRAIRIGEDNWDDAVVFDGNYPALYAGAPSLAAATLSPITPTAFVTYPVHEGDPPVANYVYFNSFTPYYVWPPTQLDATPLPCGASAVAVTPGDIIHVAWQEEPATYYRVYENGVWSDTVRVSTPPPHDPTSEPADHPSLEAYGEYIYCVWHGPNEQGGFPGDVWQRRRWLSHPPGTWYEPEDLSRSSDRESDFPVMATDFVSVWHEEVEPEANWDIWGKFAPDPAAQPFFETARPSRYPHVGGHWLEEPLPRYHCNTVWTEELSPNVPLYEVRFGDKTWVQSDGSEYEPGSYYPVAVGEPARSPYCMHRDGYRTYRSFRVDSAGDELTYILPYLDPRRSYDLRAVGYHEGRSGWTVDVLVDSSLWARATWRPGVAETVRVRIPRQAYQDDAAVEVKVSKVKGDFVSLAGLKVFQVEEHQRGYESGQDIPGTEFAEVRLFQNSPNPFSTRTLVRYQLPRSSDVAVDIFDASGRLVRELVNEHQEAGTYSVPWDGRDSQSRLLAAGVYFTRLRAAGTQETRRTVLAR